MICIIQSDTGIHIREKKRERNPGVLVQAVKFELFENVMKGAGGSIFHADGMSCITHTTG